MSEAKKTVSELAFEKYLEKHNLKEWEYEPIIPGKSQRPDYRFRSGELFFEVKEFISVLN